LFEIGISDERLDFGRQELLERIELHDRLVPRKNPRVRRRGSSGRRREDREGEHTNQA
jgi:hypothetical protein